VPNAPRPDNKPHMIRFTDTEWQQVLDKAAARGITAAELVRVATWKEVRRPHIRGDSAPPSPSRRRD